MGLVVFLCKGVYFRSDIQQQPEAFNFANIGGKCSRGRAEADVTYWDVIGACFVIY